MNALHIHPRLIGATVIAALYNGVWKKDINETVIAAVVGPENEVVIYCQTENGTVYKYNLDYVRIKFTF